MKAFPGTKNEGRLEIKSLEFFISELELNPVLELK